MTRWAGMVAVVTGAASGIGRASAKAIAAEGGSVLATDIDVAGAEKTLSMIDGRGLALALDVTLEPAWESVFQRALAEFGRVDILVNCAGIGISGDVEDIELESWNRVLAVNLTGTMLGCKHAIRAMKASGSAGSIVNISSIGGLLGTADLAAYSASKGGVTLLTKCVALNCAERGYGIRCNAIMPTYVDTEMLEPVAEQVGGREAMLAGMKANIPLGRLARPEDIAHSVVFLASHESAMITGTSFLVDGGTSAGLPSRHSSAA